MEYTKKNYGTETIWWMIDDSIERKCAAELFHFSSSFGFAYPLTFAQRSHKKQHIEKKTHIARPCRKKNVPKKKYYLNDIFIQLRAKATSYVDNMLTQMGWIPQKS